MKIIKNGRNDKKKLYFSFSHKKIQWYIIPSKNENLANFSISNLESGFYMRAFHLETIHLTETHFVELPLDLGHFP